MKHTILALALAAFISPVAFAADHEHKDENSVDVSKNPITGTVTTTKKSEHKVKRGKGHAKVSVTEKTKEMTDGSTEKTKEVETESHPNH